MIVTPELAVADGGRRRTEFGLRPAAAGFFFAPAAQRFCGSAAHGPPGASFVHVYC